MLLRHAPLALICVLACGLPLHQAAAAERTNVRLLSKIDTKNWGSEQIRIGDLDGDGGPDLIVAQSNTPTREITCLTAVTIDGKVLWQTGEPSLDNGQIYSDLPLQIYDWDNDGKNEVLYIKHAKYLDPWDGKANREHAHKYEGNATMVVLDGATGQEKATVPIPAPADDSFLFADLTGRGRREDLVVKDRYWNAWGVSHEGKVLWQYTGSVGHYPAVMDLDGDGKDETFLGYTLVGPDGKVRWSVDPNKPWAPTNMSTDADGKITWAYDTSDASKRLPRTPLHADACYPLRLANGDWRLFFGNTGIHAMSVDGKELWHDTTVLHGQHVVAGRFRKDSEYQLAIVDRKILPNTLTPRDKVQGSYFLFGLDGKHLWEKKTDPGDWGIACTTVDWNGPKALQNIMLYGFTHGQPARMLDGDGNVVVEFPMVYSAPISEKDQAEGKFAGYDKRNFYVLNADVWGDAREEVILFGSRGLCIYTNAAAFQPPTLYNETLYPGM